MSGGQRIALAAPHAALEIAVQTCSFGTLEQHVAFSPKVSGAEMQGNRVRAAICGEATVGTTLVD